MFEEWYNIIKNNIVETGVTKVFDDHYKGEGIILDIGGNVGAFSDYVLDKYPEKEIHLFEPVVKFSSYLDKKYQNTSVRVNKVALGEEHKIIFMDEHVSNLGVNVVANTSTDGGLRPNTNDAISMITLDSYIINNSLTNIGFIKMDTEYYEPFIFEGMKNYLESTPQLELPVIVFESGKNHLHQQKLEEAKLMLSQYYTLSINNTTKPQHEVICLPKNI